MEYFKKRKKCDLICMSLRFLKVFNVRNTKVHKDQINGFLYSTCLLPNARLSLKMENEVEFNPWKRREAFISFKLFNCLKLFCFVLTVKEVDVWCIILTKQIVKQTHVTLCKYISIWELI